MSSKRRFPVFDSTDLLFLECQLRVYAIQGSKSVRIVANMCLCNKNCYYNCNLDSKRKSPIFKKSHSSKTGCHFQMFQIRYSATEVINITSHTGEADLHTL